MTKVLDAYLNPGGNHPKGSQRVPGLWRLNVLLDKIPDLKDYRYNVIKIGEGSTLYVGVVDGVFNFFHHLKRDEHGYGGAVIGGTTIEGEKFTTKGPWSSSTEAVNSLGLFSKCYPAAAAVNKEDWNRGYLSGLSGISHELVEQALTYLPGWKVHEITSRPVSPVTVGLSDEQMGVVTGERRDWIYYEPGLPICDKCKGEGFITAKEGEPRAFKSYRKEGWTRACPDCDDFLWSGIANVPVPGTRRCRLRAS